MVNGRLLLIDLCADHVSFDCFFGGSVPSLNSLLVDSRPLFYERAGRKATSIREDAAAEEAAEPAAPAYKASTALPFLECPPNLDGSLAGDVGK